MLIDTMAIFLGSSNSKKTVRQKSPSYYLANQRHHIPTQVVSAGSEDQGGNLLGAVINIKES